MASGESDFYSLVVPRYRRRELGRAELKELVRLGLERVGGRYRELAALFGVAPTEYRRFMSFLRDNRLQLDYRPFRSLAKMSVKT